MNELAWKQRGTQDPQKIPGYRKGAMYTGDVVSREAKVGLYRIVQYQRIRASLEEDPYRLQDYWVYGPGKKPLLCVVQPDRLDEFLPLLETVHD